MRFNLLLSDDNDVIRLSVPEMRLSLAILWDEREEGGDRPKIEVVNTHQEEGYPLVIHLDGRTIVNRS